MKFANFIVKECIIISELCWLTSLSCLCRSGNWSASNAACAMAIHCIAQLSLYNSALLQQCCHSVTL